MARDFAKRFYKSKQWKSARASYVKSVNGLCERCLRNGRYSAGEIVHHKRHLSPSNIDDPSVTLSFENLELLCRDCHAKEHPEIYGKTEMGETRVRFDVDGNVIRA